MHFDGKPRDLQYFPTLECIYIQQMLDFVDVLFALTQSWGSLGRVEMWARGEYEVKLRHEARACVIFL